MLSDILFLFIIVSCLYLGALVYYKDPDGKDNRRFVLLVFWLIPFLSSNYLENEPYSEPVRIFFLKMDFICAQVLGLYWFLFCYHFLEKKKFSKAILSILFLSVLALSIMVFYDLIITNIRADQSIIQFSSGPAFLLYALFIFIFYIGSTFFLIEKFRRFQGEKRLQTLFVMFGLSICSFTIIILGLFMQNKVSVAIYRLSTYSALAISIFTALAIIRYKLFDIRYFIQRSVIYGGIVSIVFCSYLVLVNISGLFFDTYTKISILFSAGIASVFGSLSMPLLEKKFRKWTDRLFYKDRYDYGQLVYELSEILNKNLDLNDLLNKSCFKLKEAFRLHGITFVLLRDGIVVKDGDESFRIKENYPDYLMKFIKEEKLEIIIHSRINAMISEANDLGKPFIYIQTLNFLEQLGLKYNSSLTVFLYLKNDLLGFVSLGEKLSGEMFTKEDFSLLKTFAYQAALAIEKATLYEKIKNYSQELEKQVEDRTGKIKALQEDQKRLMLEIAHDLQTPLTILKTELSMLNVSEKDKENLNGLNKSIDRISNFIYNILRLAKLDMAITAAQEKFDLSELLEELAENFSIIIRDKGIVLETDIAKNIFIKGNKHEIEEMVTNLISNSVRYIGEKNEKLISLSLGKEKDLIEIKVADNGSGIEKEQLFSINEALSSKQNQATYKYGNGLGLAICKKIIGRHDGNIEIASKFGEGTVIRTTFPPSK